MLIALEGCDGTGKSTLVKLLKACYNVSEVIHCTAETPNDYEYFKDIIDRARYRHIICDRFFWGQFVYQIPEQRKLTEQQLIQLYNEMWYINQNNKVILVEAPVSDVLSRLHFRNETTELPVSFIMQQFRIIARKASYRIPVFVYNSSNGKIERMK